MRFKKRIEEGIFNLIAVSDVLESTRKDLSRSEKQLLTQCQQYITSAVANLKNIHTSITQNKMQQEDEER